MPIETITKNGKKRLRWTFQRVIAGERIRRTKIIPAGITAAEADSLARKWEAEEYALASGERKPLVTIWHCVLKHMEDKQSGWKDAEKRMRILDKWSEAFAEQDATSLHDWSVTFTGYLRAKKDSRGNDKKPLTNGSISNIFAYIRAAIRYAYKVGMIDVNDTPRLAIPQVNNQRHHYPDRAEMVAIAKNCHDSRARAVIRIAFYSGMRLSEILGTTKNGKPRIVPIHPKIAVCTRRIKLHITPASFDHYWIVARTKAGYTHTRFHDLRHGAASEMINAGVDLYTVGGVLGHATTVSTQRYAHLVTAKLSDAVGRIGKGK
jgi:integrase